MDIVSKTVRSRMMSGIRGQDTKPELQVRRYLHANGFRFRLHDKRLPGHPDVVLPKYHVCIFVHGCFWHRHVSCRYATTPHTRADFWANKFADNVRRDQEVRDRLLEMGWRIIVVWECGLKSKVPEMLDWLPDFIVSGPAFIVWPKGVKLGEN
ncbi:very short patch repair endonuclease [Andreprevotia chitinilytica]|uniref:very short patch repair endonuclease n=1 Tax=Andreprevotia chitinilytica TaxID=396808 RepID=UPI0005572790|nr:very short patch repair endonuclease [Andreprevotia chitinilytica]